MQYICMDVETDHPDKVTEKKNHSNENMTVVPEILPVVLLVLLNWFYFSESGI